MIRRRLPVTNHTFVDAVGVGKILAGILVWFLPRYGDRVVGAWLWAIIASRRLLPAYFDSARRGLALSLGVPSLARQSAARGRAATSPAST